MPVPTALGTGVTNASGKLAKQVFIEVDGDPGKLFHMQTNLRFGCVILRHYLEREKGNMYLALGRYNGSRGKPQYPNAVFAAQRQWVFQAQAQI